MMGGEAFILLKGGHAGPESTKRAKIRLAILLKILHIVPTERRSRVANIEKETWKGCI
jgi:transcriptional regulator of met regulon